MPAAESAPTPEVVSAVREDLATTAHDIPIPQNDRVLGYVEAFQGRLRNFLTDGLTRGAEYLPMIHEVFREEGLPLDLAYVPLVESAFKPTALSRASARGVWQFMRATGRENGLQHDWYIDERADPEKATRAAAKYLKTLHRLFDGDWHLALASYNGGPGRVQRAVKRSGIDDFWQLSASKKKLLPRETRDYVPMILAAMIIARNPAQYRLRDPGRRAARRRAGDAERPGRPAAHRRVGGRPGRRHPRAQPRAAALDDAGARRRLRGAGASRHGGGGERSASRDRPRGRGVAAVVRGAQGRIAGDHRPQAAGVAHRSRRGQLPARPPPRSGRARSWSSPARPRRRCWPAATAPRPRPLPTDRDRRGGRRRAPTRLVYRVRRGDTLYGIARKHGVTVEELRAWNNLRGSAIGIGDRLSIHSRGDGSQ